MGASSGFHWHLVRHQRDILSRHILREHVIPTYGLYHAYLWVF